MRRRARASAGPTPLARLVLTLPTILLYRLRAIGLENVPRGGALVLAPNHFSQMDHFFIGVYLRRKIRFMAKSQMFGPPVLTYIYKHGGVFPIRRGHRDEEAFETAYAILDQGEMLLVYAEGGRSRSRELGSRETGDRPDRPGDRARRSSRSRSTARPRCAAGSGCASRRSRSQFGEPLTFPVETGAEPRAPAGGRDQIFARVREMYEELSTRSGRRAARRSSDRARA